MKEREKHLCCLLISEQEIEKIADSDPGILKCINDLKQHHIQVSNIETICSMENLQKHIRDAGFTSKECMLMSATDKKLRLIEHLPIASIGIETDYDRNQSLSQAQIIIQGFAEIDYYFLERIWQRKNGIPWTVFETDRCYVREMTMNDLEDLYEMYKGNGMTDYMEPLYDNYAKEYEYQKAYIDNMYWFYGYGMWLVFEKTTDKLIGRAGLDHQEIQGEMKLEMGYAIATEYQRKGYAVEICKMIMEYVRQALDFSEIHCLVEQENTASLALLKKLGYKRCELAISVIDRNNRKKNMEHYVYTIK